MNSREMLPSTSSMVRGPLFRQPRVEGASVATGAHPNKPKVEGKADSAPPPPSSPRGPLCAPLQGGATIWRADHLRGSRGARARGHWTWPPGAGGPTGVQVGPPGDLLTGRLCAGLWQEALHLLHRWGSCCRPGAAAWQEAGYLLHRWGRCCRPGAAAWQEALHLLHRWGSCCRPGVQRRDPGARTRPRRMTDRRATLQAGRGDDLPWRGPGDGGAGPGGAGPVGFFDEPLARDRSPMLTSAPGWAEDGGKTNAEVLDDC